MTISAIIIDGYNLIGIMHRDLQKKREELIRKLIDYKRLKGHDIAVVFDGWKSGGHKEEQSVTGGVRVVYSRLGDRADLVIKKMISRDRKDWIVVTSDREIADYAWSHGSVPVSSDQFTARLEHAESILEGEHEPLEENEDTDHRKGNPRQLSKKEKALSRAIAKL